MTAPWRVLVGAGVLGLVVHQVGTGPFVAALGAVHWWVLAAGVAITALTTACSAQRWRLIAAQSGQDAPLPTALQAYYRAQFLNVTLPGGVLGDAHRAWRHGLRGVFWDRTAGQAVQVGLAVLVLLLVPSTHRNLSTITTGIVVLLVVLLVLRRFLPSIWLQVAALSAVAVVGYAALFVVVARAAGVTAELATLLPVTLLVLLATAVPVSLAGWGPREGAAAWAFGAAGVGAAEGVTVSVLYGAVVLVASLPGALVLLRDGRRR